MGGKTTAPHQKLGGKLGPRLSVVLTKAWSHHLIKTGGYRAQLHAEGLNQFFRGMSREKWQHTAPYLAQYLGAEGNTPEVERLLQFVTHGQGELSEVMHSLGMGQALGTSILGALENYLAPVNQALIAAHPNSLLDPGTLAAAVQAQVMEEQPAKADAARGGINAERFDVLRAMAVQFPGVAQLTELWRRGLIQEGDVTHALERQGVAIGFINPLRMLKREILAPADLALAVLRGIISEGEGAHVAAQNGVDAHDFNVLVKNTGEPPGLMQLLEAYRRGFIDLQRLDLGIKQSRVRDEWSDVVQKLRFTPASTSDAARAVVQNHLSDVEGKQIAEWNGLRPEDWHWLIKTVGNPPGPMEMLSLYNRGQVSREAVEQSLRESHIKDEYIPHILQLRVKIPPSFQIGKMVETGSMTARRALQLLRDSGYEQDVAESFVHSHGSGQVIREKQLAVTDVRELYHDHALTRVEALKHLEALGYHKANAELVLAATDLGRERALQTAAVAPVKAAYIAHHITETEASADLDKLRVPAAQRDYMLALWAIDRSTHKRTLTEAQIVKANEKGLFTDAVAIQRLERLGYSNEDSRIILDLEKHRTANV